MLTWHVVQIVSAMTSALQQGDMPTIVDGDNPPGDRGSELLSRGYGELSKVRPFLGAVNFTLRP